MSFLQKLFRGTSSSRNETLIQTSKAGTLYTAVGTIESLGKDLVPNVEHEEFNPYTELTILQHHTDIVRQVFILNRRRCLSVADDNIAIVWDLLIGVKVAVLCGHSRPITCVLRISSAVNSSSHLIITGSSDKHIKVWDYEQGVCLQTITEHSSSVKCLLLLENGTFVSGGEKLHLWSAEGKLLDSCHRTEVEADITLMILTRNERIVTAANKDLLVYHVIMSSQSEDESDDLKQELVLFRTLKQTREAVRCLLNISETLFAVGCLDGCIYVISTETYQISLQFTSPDKYKGDNCTYPYSIQDMVCADKRYIFAAVGSGFAVFDIKTKHILCKPHICHLSKILHMSFVCERTLLATSSEDGSIRLWGRTTDREASMYKTVIERFFNISFDDLEDGLANNSLPSPNLLGECLGHSGAVNMVVDGGGDIMVSCGVDGLVICWKNANIQKMKRNQILQKEVLMGNRIV